ncbi:hypothetical protein BHM03_00059637 [Ensete ventricosum]|nr:hypothetical protein BHM03_00059637 [Ensete ventricosum]
MKITALLLLSTAGDCSSSSGPSDPVVLANASDVSHFGYFQRKAAKEFILFIARTVAKRTPHGQRQSVQHEGFLPDIWLHLPSSCQSKVHSYNRNGLCALAFMDDHYPVRKIDRRRSIEKEKGKKKKRRRRRSISRRPSGDFVGGLPVSCRRPRRLVTDNNVNKVFDEMLMFVCVLRFVYIQVRGIANSKDSVLMQGLVHGRQSVHGHPKAQSELGAIEHQNFLFDMEMICP